MYILTFPSTHMAIYAEKALLQAGFSVGVMPLPSSIKAGCGIALRVEDFILSRELLSKNNIVVSDVYQTLQKEHGTEFSKVV